jgi:hypothetical protein
MCQNCSADSRVKACIQNPVNMSTLIMTECVDGSYLSNGQCVDCSNNCTICYGNVQQTASACLKCQMGFYLGEDNLCRTCPDTGNFFDGQVTDMSVLMNSTF